MDSQLQFLLRTLIGEARGEPAQGIIGVGCVIRNRVFASKKSYQEVVTAKEQFSCWNVTDLNYDLIKNIDLENPSDKFIKQCVFLGQGIFYNDVIDTVGGSRNYVTLVRYQQAKTNNGPKDQWIIKMKPFITLGTQIFYYEHTSAQNR